MRGGFLDLSQQEHWGQVLPFAYPQKEAESKTLFTLLRQT
jgi:hypothetical protein